MQKKNEVSNLENIVPFNEFRLKQELSAKIKEFSALYERYNFSQLVEESYDLIDAIKETDLDIPTVARTKCLIQELKNRCASHGESLLGPLNKMQQHLEEKLNGFYKHL